MNQDKKHNKIVRLFFTNLGIVWCAIIIGLSIFVGFYLHSMKPPKTVISIENSGSTNFVGWNLRIYNNGGGSLTYTPRGRLPPAASGNKDFVSGSFETTALLQTLKATNLRFYHQDCVRSVSFGSSETLVYGLTRTPDIDCYILDYPTTRLSVQLVVLLRKAGLD